MKKDDGTRSDIELLKNEEQIRHYENMTLWLLIVGAIVAIIMLLTGCAEVVREYAIDSRYTVSYTETKTRYTEKYNWHEDKYELVPETYTVAHPEKYELLYHMEYDNGSEWEEWREVTKKQYYDFEKEQGRG